MADPLTYPPEIIIESSIELPPSGDGSLGTDVAWLLIEIVLELLLG